MAGWVEAVAVRVFVRQGAVDLRQGEIAKLSFDESHFRCGERRLAILFKRRTQSYLQHITRNGERPMARMITVVMTVSVLVAALSPALYAYASLA